ncbi:MULTISPECIES: DUF3307 domain-containing protein [unclassified Ruegeria]|uniref:DUF3307 domain-containing protein n=1 Tax=unclassified Ruegeria TaxID=2625375 RepID=UPI001489C64C|nr:DUF3307 domain-containing protein [Ruegeria sp. HKCCD8929]
MPVSIGTVLLVLCLLQIKHMFADYFLQTPKMLAGRGEYFHLGRAQHAGVHVIGSAAIFLLVGAPIGFVLIMAVLEWVVHFNIDFGKACYSDKKGLQPNQPAFWRAAGLDQALHHLTYIAMTWAWVEFAH